MARLISAGLKPLDPQQVVMPPGFSRFDVGILIAHQAWQAANAWKITQDDLVFNPSGPLFVSTFGSEIHVWDTETAKELAVLQGHTGRARYVVFSNDGTTLLSQGDDSTARRWQVK